ncbi:MAG: hypothetical protein VKS61_00685 [Candidatus Sericytochromatia bacterium]|nr:hypothetical protein [Candidatus Sericytochromatia bacterium]
MSKPLRRVRPIVALALLVLGCQAPVGTAGPPVGPGAAGGRGRPLAAPAPPSPRWWWWVL